MRFPNIHGDRVVFEAHGNLWTADVAGGIASQLTTGLANDAMPRFSPDGRWIAFSRSTATTEDVYVVPATGGDARRLTFRSSKVGGPGPTYTPDDNIVVTWTPDSKNIVFLSRRKAFNWSDLRLYRIPVEGGLPQALPLGHAGLATFSASGHELAYTQTLSEFQARKRYEGGLAPDVYTIDLLTGRKQRVTDWKGADTSPMWAGDRIYFLSDRDVHRRMNLWVYDRRTKRTRAVTHFVDYDVDLPSLGDRAISFQKGGHLYRLSLPDEMLQEIVVDVPDDRARTGAREVNVTGLIRGTDGTGRRYALSPDGDAAVFSARGDLFRISNRAGTTEQLTRTSVADEDQPAYSADGRTLAYMSDLSGEQQVWLHSFDGSADRMLTHFVDGYRNHPIWSPDGKSLAMGDGDGSLWLVSVTSGAARRVTRSVQTNIDDAAFSPDGRWLAYSTTRTTGFHNLHVFDVPTGEDRVVSSPMNSDFAPAFSADGNDLFFVSRRRHAVVSAENELGYADVNTSGIYVATLKPHSAASDGVLLSASPGLPSRDDAPQTTIDFAQAVDRAVSFASAPGVISAMVVRGSRLFYRTGTSSTYGDDLPRDEPVLHVFDLTKRSDTRFVTGLDSFDVSSDGRTVLYQNQNTWHSAVVGADPQVDTELNLAGLQSTIVPTEEWKAMFDKAWRLERDLFFDASMDGTDWQAIHDRYAVLLPLLGSRDDLNYLIEQMVGELASSHTFVYGGDNLAPTGKPTRLLGVDFELDPASDRYRIAKIYRGDNTRHVYRNPLTEPGIDIPEGSYVLAVNGQELLEHEDPYAHFVDVGDTVTLTVAASPRGEPHSVTVKTLSNEMSVRKLDWIENNRKFVEHFSNGQIGYLYLSDFDDLGMLEFMQQFFAQTDKRGLIVDVRWNEGGHTSQWILSHLLRVNQGGFINRRGGQENLEALISGPKVVLTNAFTASDGDQFAYFFRRGGFGRVLGERTWGGVRGIDESPDLLDGGHVTIPNNALHDVCGHPLIENYGSEPDIAIEDDATGVQLLKKGTTVLLSQLARGESRLKVPLVANNGCSVKSRSN